MGRAARDRRDPPHPKPVERIELNGAHMGRRLALAAALLLIGAGLLAYSAEQWMTPQSEWIAVEAEAGAGPTCAEDFVFLYRLGGGELSPAAEQKAVRAAYTRLCRGAFELFHNQMAFEGVNNVYAINRRPNEELEVDGGLYAAFAAAERSGNRALYLGPVYDRYKGIFTCEDDSLLADFDPRLSEEVAREYAGYAAFAADPRAVQVELLGENRICLRVSEEYLSYARREGVESFIDFAWMSNAFIADYLAEGLSAQGFGRGALTSYDGFVRNMDSSGEEYALQLYDRRGRSVYPAAVMRCQGPASLVSLRDYPLNEQDAARFYELRSGEIRTPYLDIADGFCKSSVHDLTCYAAGKGCGDVLLAALPVYAADSFDRSALDRLAAEGIDSVYCEDGVIYATQADLTLTELYDRDGVRYTRAPAGSGYRQRS